MSVKPIYSLLKRHRVILGIIILASFLRLLSLGVIPAGINFDEIDYIINAKSVFWSGSDISGQWNPWSLTPLPNEDPKSEIIPLLLAPILGPLPFSLFIVKLPFAIAGIIQVWLIYLIAKKLFNTPIGLLSAFVMAINPLAWFSSRIGFDGPLSSTFLLTAFTIILYRKDKHILWALPFIFLSFYGYIGMKLTVVPFIIVTLLYSFYFIHKRKSFKLFTFIGVFAVVIISSYFLRLSTLSSSGRAANIFLPSSQSIIDDVNIYRRDSLVLSPVLQKVIVNKWTIYGFQITKRFFNVFNPNQLFFAGDTYHAFFVWHHGFYYVIDAIFIGIGLFFLFRKYSKQTFFLLLLIFVAALPALLGSEPISYAYRAYTSYLLFTLVIGAGIYAFIKKTAHHQHLALSAIGLIYVIMVINFGYESYARNPVYHQDQAQLTHRVLSRYLEMSQAVSDKPVTVVTADPRQLMQQYILFSGIYNNFNKPEVIDRVNQAFSTNNLIWENIVFTADCSYPTKDNTSVLILKDDQPCEELKALRPKTYQAIPRISDNGKEMIIFGSDVCTQYELQPFVSHITYDQLQIEKLSDHEFCQTYITGER